MKKIFFKLLLLFFFSFIAIFAFSSLLFQFKFIREKASQTLVHYIEKNTKYQVQATILSSSHLFSLKLQNFHLKQKDVSLLHVEHLQINLSPLSFLKKLLIIQNISADGIFLNLNAFKTKTTKSNLSDSPSLFIESLFYFPLHINHFSFSRVQLSQSLPRIAIKDERFYGDLIIDTKNQAIYSTCFIEQLNQKRPSKLTLLLKKSSPDELSLQVHVSETKKGLLHQSLELPETLACHASIKAKGSFLSWFHFALGHNLSKEESITGNIDISFLNTKNPPLKNHPTGFNFSGHFTIKDNPLFIINHIKGHLLFDNKRLSPFKFEGVISLNSDLILDDTTLTLTTDDLSLLQETFSIPISGKGKISCDLSGSIKLPKAKFYIKSDVANIGNSQLKNFSTTIFINFQQEKIGAYLQSETTVEGIPFRLSANLFWNRDFTLSLSDLKLQAPKTKLHGNLQLSLIDGVIQGMIDGQSDDLALIKKLFKYPLEGKIKAKFVFQPDTSNANPLFAQSFRKQALTIDLKIHKAKLEKVSIDEITVYGNFLDPFHSAKGHIRLVGSQAFYYNFLLDDFTIKASLVPNSSKTSLSFTGKGRWHHTFTINSNALLDLSKDSIRITIEKIESKLSRHHISLQKPFFIDVYPQMQFSKVSLKIDDGFFKAFHTKRKNEWDTRILLENIPITALSFINPDFPLNGMVSGEIEFLYPSIEGSLSLNIKDLKPKQNTNLPLPSLDATIIAAIGNHMITAQGNILGLGNQSIKLRAHIPLTFLSSDQPHSDLELQLSASGEIGDILDFVDTKTSSLSGNLTLDLLLKGPIYKPSLTGKATLSQGTYENLSQGIILKDLTCNLEAKKNKILVNSFNATDGEKGTVDATGEILLDLSQNFPFIFHLNFNQATLLRLDYANVTTTGSLDCLGDIFHPKVEGNLTLNQVVVNIPDTTPVSFNTVDVLFVNSSTPEALDSNHSINNPIELNIKINSPKKMYVNGRNLKSEWKGEVFIKGTSEKPKAYGAFKIIQATFQIGEKEFASHQGQIHFSGNIDTKSTIYILAQEEINGIKINAILKGAVFDPKIAFRSNPPLSQQEILSRILFGKSIEEISPIEAAQLSQTILSINSNNESDLLSKVRKSIGIDRIDVNTNPDNDNDLSISVGKYISKGVLITLHKSVYTEQKQIAIEADLKHNFKIEAKVGNDAQRNMSIKWKKDY